MSTDRIFTNTHILILIVWWAASGLLSFVILNETFVLVARIAAGFLLWAPLLAAPIILTRRSNRLDEMQQLMLWRTLGGAVLFITGYLAAMAAYFVITGGAARSLMTLCAMAGPMALVFTALMTRLAERQLERVGDEQAP